jgi:NADH:ubiquinone oxidoreductase subunit 6 (subunit J)
MDLHALLFWAIASLTGLCAIAVVVTQNIVRTATWLLFALAGTSGIFFLLGADFVGATQLLVYVGGTLVLVVFGVMLTAQGPFISMKTGPAEWAIATLVGLLLYGVLAASIVISPSRVEARKEEQDAARLLAAAHKLEKSQPLQVTKTVKAYEAVIETYPLSPFANIARQRLELLRGEPITDVKGDAGLSLTSVELGQALLGIEAVTPVHKLTGLPRGVDRNRKQVSYLLPFEIVSVHLLVVLIGAAYLARAKRRPGAPV